MSIAPDDPRHGTENGYGNLKCRCDRCRRAHAAYWLERAHVRGRVRPMSVYLAERYAEPPPHGSESRYTHHGCRCRACRNASADARARRRAASQSREGTVSC